MTLPSLIAQTSEITMKITKAMRFTHIFFLTDLDQLLFRLYVCNLIIVCFLPLITLVINHNLGNKMLGQAGPNSKYNSGYDL